MTSMASRAARATPFWGRLRLSRVMHGESRRSVEASSRSRRRKRRSEAAARRRPVRRQGRPGKRRRLGSCLSATRTHSLHRSVAAIRAI